MSLFESFEKRKRVRSPLELVAAWLIGLIVSLYAVNALIIFSFQPSNFQLGGEAVHSHDIGTNEIFGVEDLKSGGLGVIAFSAGGYVNLLEEEPRIYLNSSHIDPSDLSTDDYVYRHEFAHVLQKELVAETAGGYPSYLSPIQSFRYYYELWRLNRDLEELMPPMELPSPVPGLESAADCYAQPASDPENPVYHRAQYLGDGSCTAEQRKIAIGLIAGKWPAPLSEEELAELKPAAILTDPADAPHRSGFIKHFLPHGKYILEPRVKVMLNR